MKLLVVGSVAFDAIETPFGKTDKIIGGAATYSGISASYFGKDIKLVSVVGEDFPTDMIEKFGQFVQPLMKTRYSGFFNTNMDSVLRARGIRNLVFVGIATNVCVESSLRDAFHLEYFGVMLEDATHHLGPDFIQQATVYNVEKFFGWVSTVHDFCGAISQAAPAEAAE